jgi:hypothetical protein
MESILAMKVRHHGFAFFVDEQKIKVAVAPGAITVKVDSESLIILRIGPCCSPPCSVNHGTKSSKVVG